MMPSQSATQVAPASSVRVLWGLLAAALLLPALLLGIVAWQTRQGALAEAASTTSRIGLTLHGHAQHVFETYELVMDRVQDRIGSQTWEEVQQSADIHALLKSIADQHDQIGTMLLFDAQGDARSSSVRFPTSPVNVSDRDYMRAFRSGHRDLFVGETIQGRTTGNTAFNIARPLFGKDGSFRGAIVLAAYPSYFADFYQRTTPDQDHSAGLVRSDGVFLVRDAVVQPSREQPRATGNFMRAIQQADAGQFTSVSAVDGIERIVTYRKLERYPVYAIFGLGTHAVLSDWRKQMGLYVLFTIPAVIGLVIMTGLALARTKREQEAMERLRQEIGLREETEEKLRQSQKLEALAGLTSGIAHDFNNLLTVVMGNLDLLRRAKDDRKPRLIENAMHAVEQGRRITGQLLAFGRRQPLLPQATNLAALIVSMDDMLAQSLRGDIRLELDLADDLWLVEVDPTQLQVALINLAVNARDAMPKGGALTIKAANTVLRDGDTVEGVALSVADTGHGMPRDVLARAFEPFFTTKDTGKGTGLGLAQVYGFAQQSGGSVEITSEDGRGTTVTLYLQKAKTTPAAKSGDAAEGSSETRPLHILLVDDNPHVAEVAAALLAEQGHQVTTVRSGDEALRTLEASQSFDLVFSDLVMPGEKDGLDVARIVRERWPTLPVLLATGYSEAASRAKQEGFTLLAKPYTPDLLADAVKRFTPENSTPSGRVLSFSRR